MKILSEDFDHEEEMQPNGFLYKKLWLEAEAELCSVNHKARYNRMRIEMEKSELQKAKGNNFYLKLRVPLLLNLILSCFTCGRKYLGCGEKTKIQGFL